jgi:GNAT superfamily N-acetyltransferase
VQIDYYANRQHFLPVLAGWHHDEWGRFSPGSTLEARIARYRTYGVGRIPCGFVAFDGDTPTGSANLVRHDLETRMDLSPWLAAVYVVPAYRRRGIATALCARVVAEAAALEVDTLYLFTPDRESFYAKRGWRRLGRADYRGAGIVIMSIRPRTAAGDAA